MQPSPISTDTPLAGPRADTAATARAPADAAASGRTDKPFGAVFDASSERPGQPGPNETDQGKSAGTLDKAEPDASPDASTRTDDTEDPSNSADPAGDDSPAERPDPAIDPGPASPGDAERGKTAPSVSPTGMSSSAEAVPEDAARADAPAEILARAHSGPGQADPAVATPASASSDTSEDDGVGKTGTLAASVLSGSARSLERKSGSEAAILQRGTISDRTPASRSAAPFAAPAPPGSDAGSAAAQTVAPLVADLAVGRAGRNIANSLAGHLAVGAGSDDARPSARGEAAFRAGPGASGMPGHAGDAMRPTIAISTLLSEGTDRGGAEKRHDSDSALGVENRGARASTLAPATLTTLPRSDMAQTAAMQIAAAIHRGGSGKGSAMELRLAPEELGHVRLTFTHSDSGVSVNVHADRAETLELLRRNIDTLAREFLEIGYGSAEFTFDRDDARPQGMPGGIPKADADAAPWIAPGPAQPTTPVLALWDRVDIRL